MFNQLDASCHPVMEPVITRVQREIIPDSLFRIRILRPSPLGSIRSRPRWKLRKNAGVVDVENPAQQLHPIHVVLLAGIWVPASVSKTLPPGNSPAEGQKDVAKFTEETQVRLVRDLFPFDVVKVAFEFAESFYLEHAAEDAG